MSKDREPVVFSNCSIKKARLGDEFELILSDKTEITKSTKQFDGVTFDDQLISPSDVSKEVTLKEIDGLPSYQRVTVRVKVFEMSDTKTLEDGHRVQSVVVSDQTATSNLALWQDFVGTVTESKSYQVSNVMVKWYEGKYSLFTPKQYVTIDEIDDISDATEVERQIKTITNCSVIAVSDFVSTRVCLTCHNGYVVPLDDNPTCGRCSKCPTITVLVLANCKLLLSATLVIAVKDLNVKLAATGQLLATIAGSPPEKVTDISLLMSKPFDATYNADKMTLINVIPCQTQLEASF